LAAPIPAGPAASEPSAPNLPDWLIGPCLETASRLPRGIARLVYLDPPFLTGRPRVGPARSGAADARASTAADRYVFDDRWPGRLATYLPWLEANLRALLPLLMPGGSLVLHLDARTVHYAKVLLDWLMGEQAFINEIIWHYTGGGRSKTRFSNKHDTLLWYATGPRPVFNVDAVRVPYQPTSGYARSGIVSAAGRRYLPHPAGTPVDDVWDIPIVNPMSAERVGYPTQKPLALLERLIAALTNPGDLVVDLFCGSGTTLVAAARLGRRWVGGDRSPAAIACARRRMETLGS
jgi:DNA modification methylase